MIRRYGENSRTVKIKKARQSVITAAVRWVNTEDSGTVKDLHKITKAQIRLANSVTRLETLLR